MILALLTIVALHTWSTEHVYRVTVSGAPNSNITVSAQSPAGWLAGFCSATVCTREHIKTTIRAGGAVDLALHLYLLDPRARRSGSVRVIDSTGATARAYF
jgi:hypothetical protein